MWEMFWSKGVCPCRVAVIRCCKYSKCKDGDLCKNSINKCTYCAVNLYSMAVLSLELLEIAVYSNFAAD